MTNRVIASVTALRKVGQQAGDTVIYEAKDNMVLILSADLLPTR